MLIEFFKGRGWIFFILVVCLILSDIRARTALADELSDGLSDEISETLSDTVSSGVVLEGDGREIYLISTAQDLCSLSKMSSDERATLGKRFILENDIDLTDASLEFLPISIFSGELDGGGHEIKGLSISGNGRNLGFIRFIGACGSVSNLSLSGSVSMNDSLENAGGIAGVNAGRIENCAFSGTVFGALNTGGIAGKNLISANIIDCTSEARVIGKEKTGGIAGLNQGEIWDSINNGGINSEKEGIAELFLRNKAEGDEGLKNIEALWTQDASRMMGTGGIAGENEGRIRDCLNKGQVGYKRVGFETGGITGYERGINFSNTNEGAVSGRKNAGGIVGLFEPYAVNAFERDSADEVRDNLTKLTQDIDALHSAVKVQDDIEQGAIHKVRLALDFLRASIKAYKEYFQGRNDSIEADVRTQMDRIRGVRDSLDFESDKKVAEALSGLRGDIDTTLNIVDAFEEAAGKGVDIDMTNYLGRGSAAARDIFSQIDTLLKESSEIEDEGEEYGNGLSNIRDLYGSLYEYLTAAEESYKEDLRKADDDLDAQIGNIHTEVGQVLDLLKGASGVVRDNTGILIETLERLNASMDSTFDEAVADISKIRERNALEGGDVDLFEDVSDSDEVRNAGGTGLLPGVLYGGRNKGLVYAEYNAGGIAGIIDILSSRDSDFKVVSMGQISMKYRREKCASLLSCRNDGDIHGEQDYIGGIVGRAVYGAIISSNSFGNVYSENGSYVGGIAGRSGFVLRDNASMGLIAGDSYVGGIAGAGKEIHDNLSYVRIEAKENSGSIAGGRESDSNFSGNFFLSSGLGAVNGVTSGREARELTRDQMMALPNAPKEFGFVDVLFVSGNEVLKKMRVRPGYSLKEEDYPEIEESRDLRYRWDGGDFSDISDSTVINLERIGYKYTLASSEEEPEILVSGKFLSPSSVSLSYISGIDIPVKGYEMDNGYHFQIESEYDWESYNPNYRVRLKAPDKSGSSFLVAVPKRGQDIDGSFGEDDLVFLEPRMDGRYLVFDMEKPGGFYLYRKDDRSILVISLGFAAAAVLMLAGIRLRKGGRKRN